MCVCVCVCVRVPTATFGPPTAGVLVFLGIKIWSLSFLYSHAPCVSRVRIIYMFFLCRRAPLGSPRSPKKYPKDPRDRLRIFFPKESFLRGLFFVHKLVLGSLKKWSDGLELEILSLAFEPCTNCLHTIFLRPVRAWHSLKDVFFGPVSAYICGFRIGFQLSWRTTMEKPWKNIKKQLKTI